MTAGPRDRLTHIVSACDRIVRYTAGLTEDGWLGNDMAQDAVVRQIEIVGEAGQRLLQDPGGFDIAAIATALRNAYGMRNLLAHGYFGVDAGIVWATATRDIPALRDGAVKILGSDPSESDRRSPPGMAG